MNRPGGSSSPGVAASAAAAPADPSLVDAAEVASSLGVDPASGLSSATAAERLARHGPNRLDPAAQVLTWRKLLAQFTDPLIYLRVAPTGGWPAPCPCGGRTFLDPGGPGPRPPSRLPLHIVTELGLPPTSSAGHLPETTPVRTRGRRRARSALDLSAPAARP
jgi:hypothetical protein